MSAAYFASVLRALHERVAGSEPARTQFGERMRKPIKAWDAADEKERETLLVDLRNHINALTILKELYRDDDALPIRSDARVLGATVKAGDTVAYPLTPDRHAYLVPATGRVKLGDVEVNARDGAAITGVDRITVTALEDSEVVLVDAA